MVMKRSRAGKPVELATKFEDQATLQCEMTSAILDWLEMDFGALGLRSYPT